MRKVKLEAGSRLIIIFFLLALFCFLGALITTASQAAAPSKAELRETLRELLQQEPDLVLDVLRDNSEMVLDIAQQGSNQRRYKILYAQWQKDLHEPKQVPTAGRPSSGPANAPVTIVVFTDFTCMYCQQGEQLIKKVMAEYKGKVRVVYKSLPMESHPGAQEAAEFMLAAHMQDETKSWILFEDFFNNREKILGKSGDAYLRAAALEAGLNVQKLLADTKSKRVKDTLAEDKADAERLGIQGTPYYLINNLVVRGVLPENFFMQAVSMALNAAEGQ